MTHQVLDNTLVIITSDHGFELGESGPASWGMRQLLECTNEGSVAHGLARSR